MSNATKVNAKIIKKNAPSSQEFDLGIIEQLAEQWLKNALEKKELRLEDRLSGRKESNSFLPRAMPAKQATKKVEEKDTINVIEIKDAFETIEEEAKEKADEKRLAFYDEKKQGLYLSANVDYDRLFEYLGKTKASSMYENSVFGSAPSNSNDGASEMSAISTENIVKAAKHFKYFISGAVMAESWLPPPGMSTGEYEKYKLWRIFNPVMARYVDSSS